MTPANVTLVYSLYIDRIYKFKDFYHRSFQQTRKPIEIKTFCLSCKLINVNKIQVFKKYLRNLRLTR